MILLIKNIFLLKFLDSNRFGTRMLEKMGWTKGKGLGVNLDGEQNFIRVNHRMNQSGIGFTVHSNQWTQHDVSYDSLLKSLDNNNSIDKHVAVTDDMNKSNTVKSGDYLNDNKNSNNFLCDNSLEELSKNSRSRVHYKKFVKGKDTSQYNERDLANIFGKKTLYENSLDVKVNENTSEYDEKLIPDFGVTTIKTGTSINDYFKMKRQQLQQNNIRPNINDDGHSSFDKSKNKYKNDEFDNTLFDSDTMSIKEKKMKFKEITDEHILDTIPETNKLNNKTIKRKKKRKPTNILKNEIDEKTVNSIDLDKTKLNIGISDFFEKQKSKKKSNINILEENMQQNSENINEVKILKIKKIHKEIPAKGQTAESIKMPKSKKKSNINILEENIHQNNSENNNGTVKRLKIEQKYTESPAKDTKGHTPESIETNPIIISESNNLMQNVLINLLKKEPSSANERNKREIFEITRYKAEIFRFLDMDAFNFSSLNTISGYGFSENLELKVNTNNHDTEKINSLWDQAIISKYGKDAIVAKKKQKYSTKALRKKKLFMTI